MKYHAQLTVNVIKTNAVLILEIVVQDLNFVATHVNPITSVREEYH